MISLDSNGNPMHYQKPDFKLMTLCDWLCWAWKTHERSKKCISVLGCLISFHWSALHSERLNIYFFVCMNANAENPANSKIFSEQFHYNVTALNWKLTTDHVPPPNVSELLRKSEREKKNSESRTVKEVVAFIWCDRKMRTNFHEVMISCALATIPMQHH